MDEPVMLGISSADLNPLCETSETDDQAMTLQVLRDGDVVVLAVRGEIDLLTVTRLGDALNAELARAPRVLVIDLENVRFLASMGITAIALAERAATERGIDLRVVAASRATLRPLQISGMTDQIATYPSRREALDESRPGTGTTARSL